MKPLDFRDRVLLILSAHTDFTRNTEITFEQWDKMRRDLFELFGETGDMAACAHRTESTGKVCMKCGRVPQSYNTLVLP